MSETSILQKDNHETFLYNIATRQSKSKLHGEFYYVDSAEFTCARLLNKHHVSVNIKKIFKVPGTAYIVVLCRVKNRHISNFLQTIKELQNNMLLCGHSDYIEVCSKLFQVKEAS